ncbi:MAG TPA: hypothetical protein VIQ31_03260 [Phormidium sp.]
MTDLPKQPSYKIVNIHNGGAEEGLYDSVSDAWSALKKVRREFYDNPGNQNYDFSLRVVPANFKWQFNYKNSCWEWR